MMERTNKAYSVPKPAAGVSFAHPTAERASEASSLEKQI